MPLLDWLTPSLVVNKIPLLKKFNDLIMKSPVSKRLVKGAFWSTLKGGVTKGITLISSFFLAQILGQKGFGEYGIINSTVSMFGALAGLGMGLTVTKYVADLRERDPIRAGRVLALTSIITWISSLIFTISFVLLAPWLANKTLSAPHLTSLLQISAITLAMGVINSVQSAALTGSEAFRKLSYIGIVGSSFQFLVVLSGACFFKLPGAVAGLVISSIFMVIINKIGLRQEWKKLNLRITYSDIWQEREVLYRFSLPSFLSIITVGPVNWACNALLANQAHGYEQVAIYSAAVQWEQSVQFIPGLIGAATLPVMSERFGADDKKGGLKVLKTMMAANTLVVIPTAIIIAALSRFIMAGYGSGFKEGSSVLILSAGTASLIAIMSPVGQVLAARGKMWTAFLMNAGWSICFLFGSILFINLGAIGLATSKLLAYSVHAIWTFGFVFFLFRPRQKEG